MHQFRCKVDILILCPYRNCLICRPPHRLYLPEQLYQWQVSFRCQSRSQVLGWSCPDQTLLLYAPGLFRTPSSLYQKFRRKRRSFSMNLWVTLQSIQTLRQLSEEENGRGNVLLVTIRRRSLSKIYFLSSESLDITNEEWLYCYVTLQLVEDTNNISSA